MAAVFVVVALVHLPPVDNDLDNDDGWNYVLEAEMAIEGAGSAWVSGGSYLVHQNLQRLVGSVSFLPRYAFFDLWMPAWHLPSIILHALNAALLVLLVMRLGLSLELGVLAGLLFGLSPVHPHVVSWIGGTFDIFAGAFILGALICFIEQRTRFALLCVAGAFCSKENGAFIGPVLALYVLFFERKAGLKAAVKRLWPYAALELFLTGLRGLQILLAGGASKAGVLGRTIEPDLEAWFTVAPGALVAAIASPLTYVFPVDTETFALLVGGLIVLGLAVRRAEAIHPALQFGLASAWLLLLPIVLVVELGSAFALDGLVGQPRYLYLSALLATPAITMIIAGLRPGTVGRTVALLAVLGSAVMSIQDVLTLTRPDSPIGVMEDAFRSDDTPKGAKVFILNSVYDDGPFRLAMSRWLQRYTENSFYWVQRGTWRTIKRDPGRLDGLDFRAFYLQVDSEPFTPERVNFARGDRVWLLTNRGPEGNHRVTPETALITQPPAQGPARPLNLRWEQVPTDRPVTYAPRDFGGVAFSVGQRFDRPGGYVHRPAVAASVNLNPREIAGFALTLTVTGDNNLGFNDHLYGSGYVEFHWGASGVDPDDAFVVIPMDSTGQQIRIEVPLWFDPVWARSGLVQWIGIHPYDRPAQVILHSVEVLPVGG
jgi:hypothetical protein